mmetsp:Transcript_45942/g.103102  ORF Transcript_45942/g.103102 Transcript_45942/m.103102 type:complete len:741 (-) Transcript_45942:201-2423(-)
MELVNRLPRPKEPGALERLLDAQRLLCARAVSEEDCQHALSLLLELARPEEEGGFGYSPALLTAASLCETGFEPGITKDINQAARHYLALLETQIPDNCLGLDLLDEAAMQLCSLVKAQCGFGDGEIKRLDALLDQCREQHAGAASWLRFAAVEARRLWAEANEDPKVREKRLQREAAIREAREAQRQEQKRNAEKALQSAERLRLEGNDAFRQGQLPGNTAAQQHLLQAVEFYGEAILELSRCLAGLAGQTGEEVAALRRQRGLLRSNAAQVELTAQRWAEAADLASAALEDDPTSLKSYHRLAKAQLGLCDWAKAAATVDRALVGLKGDREGITELWKLAESISAELPEWQWSASKPDKKAAQDDYEKRLTGWWEYPGSSFEIKLEPWGALVFKEDTLKIELMQKSKLRWRGEVEMISGMILNLSYEPGSDVLVLEFVPPPDMPEKDQWNGPRRFTASRKEAPEDAKEPAVEEVAPEVTPEMTPESPGDKEDVRKEAEKAEEAEAKAAEETAKELAALLQAAPKEICIAGHPPVDGRYVRCEAQNQKPAYRRVQEGSERYLWFRGGNWGVTDALNSSALASPFLARCPDTAPHPLALRRRSRWHVRSGRGQEEVSPSLTVRDADDAPEIQPVEVRPGHEGASADALPPASDLPSWVESARLEREEAELRLLMVCKPGPPISIASLDMTTSECSVNVSMLGQKEVLKMELPCGIDILASPAARWSEKTRTLKVRLRVSS